MLDVKVQVLDLSGGAPAVGAALMAFRHLEWVDEGSYPDRLLSGSRVFDPELEAVVVYEAGYRDYRTYVDALF